MKTKLGIVVPCYNEQEVLELTHTRLKEFLDNMVRKEKITKDSIILLVDDGSSDSTWSIISRLCSEDTYVRGLKLAKNSGHQNALLAGLMSIKEYVDVAVSIDADLQDDVEVMEQMIDKFASGSDIVYGVRNNRDTDSFFKRTTAVAFYKLMRWLGVNSVFNHADYRLMSKRALYQLENYKERNLFLRGIVTLIGYKTEVVYYKRSKRAAGESKYPLKKMISFAIDGITSFSIKPLVYISIIGFLCVLASIAAIIYIIHGAMSGTLEPGWPSLIVSVWFLGGVQLLSLGVVGIYVGKTYIEVKERPRYNIEENTLAKGLNSDETANKQ